MKHYAIGEDGAIYEVTTKMCDNPQAVLASMVDSAVIYAGLIHNGIHCGLKMQSGQAHPLFVKEATHLRMSAQFAIHPDVDGSGELRYYVDYEGGVKACLDWVVPDGYRLFFAKNHGDLGGGYYLMLVDIDKGEFRMVPMSNCYEDCRVCTGTMDLGVTTSLMDSFSSAFNVFWKSDWNDHETHQRLFTEHNRYIFRWDMDMKQLPMLDPDAHLPKACPSFSGTNIITKMMALYPKKTYAANTDEKVGDPIIEAAEEEENDD